MTPIKPIKLSVEQMKSVRASIKEHQKFLDKEARYSAHLQNVVLIDVYKKQIAKLETMLSTGVFPEDSMYAQTIRMQESNSNPS